MGCGASAPAASAPVEKAPAAAAPVEKAPTAAPQVTPAAAPPVEAAPTAAPSVAPAAAPPVEATPYDQEYDMYGEPVESTDQESTDEKFSVIKHRKADGELMTVKEIAAAEKEAREKGPTTEEEVIIANYKAQFSMFDKDGSDTVTTTELAAVLKSLGNDPSEAELADFIHEMDATGKGYIDFIDFLRAMEKKDNLLGWHEGPPAEKSAEDELLEAWVKCDIDDKGFVTKEQLKQLMIIVGNEMDDERIDEMIQAANDDGDLEGKNGVVEAISYEQLVKMMMTPPDAE